MKIKKDKESKLRNSESGLQLLDGESSDSSVEKKPKKTSRTNISFSTPSSLPAQLLSKITEDRESRCREKAAEQRWRERESREDARREQDREDRREEREDRKMEREHERRMKELEVRSKEADLATYKKSTNF